MLARLQGFCLSSTRAFEGGGSAFSNTTNDLCNIRTFSFFYTLASKEMVGSCEDKIDGSI